jgi:hypothetical protein
MARSPNVRLVKRLRRIVRMDRHLISKVTWQERKLLSGVGNSFTANCAYLSARLLHSRAEYSG